MSLGDVTLVSTNEGIVRAWREEFAPHPQVAVVHGSIFDVEASALVSPANSFGIMDGGLDASIRDHFGPLVEERLRSRLAEQFHGELPVGLATVIETGHPRHTHLVAAPTMRCPGDVSSTINAYLAMKATLNAVRAFPLRLSLAIPAFCALTGRMAPTMVARQMRIGYERAALGRHGCAHWREERALEDYVRGGVRGSPVPGPSR
jgi:O-acetyl-ADP-ribose deacetylase (regulator of RNase III)